MLTRALVTITLALTAASSAHAQDAVSNFYKGRQLTVIIPSSVGGGYDLYGRLVARHIGKHLPGNPNVVASNMAGAAGVVAAQYVYAAGAKDGSVLGLVYPNAILEPLTGDRGNVRYDSKRFAYIGSANAEVFVCYVSTKSGVNAFADVFAREVVLGASGAGAPSSEYTAMYNNLLGAKIKVVAGYPGINEIGLAIEKREIDGTCGSSWATLTTGRPNWLRDDVVRVIAQENLAAHPDIVKLGAPLTLSFAKTPEQRQVMEFVYSLADFGRPFLMAPETPKDRVDAMRKAFSAMLVDREFLEDAARMKMEIVNPMDGATLQSTVDKLMATPADVVDRVKKATGAGAGK